MHQDQISEPMLQHSTRSGASEIKDISEAPKPPKKRYLEKEYNLNDRNNQNSTTTKDNNGLVMIFDQDNIGRAIEHALSDSIRPDPSDCPVDFSLNKTVTATSHQFIIDEIVELLLPRSKDQSDKSPSIMPPTSLGGSSTTSRLVAFAPVTNSPVPSNVTAPATSSANLSQVAEFNLEKRLAELPALEFLDEEEPPHDGLATLASVAAVALQRDKKTSNNT